MTDANNLNAGMRIIKFIIFIISFMFGVSKMMTIENFKILGVIRNLDPKKI
jgi:hypothetical protein